MSKLLLFTVFDSKAEGYLQPFFAVTEAVALRMFMTAVEDPQHDFHRFAEDYTMFRIGEFDQAEGVLVSEIGVCVAKARDLVRYEPTGKELRDESAR